jgi:hypothetical protein
MYISIAHFSRLPADECDVSRRATLTISAGTAVVGACLLLVTVLLAGGGSKARESVGTTTSTLPDLSTIVTASTLLSADRLSSEIDAVLVDLDKATAAVDAAASSEGDPSQ